MKNIANLLTISRIFIGMALFFVPFLSVAFLVLYSIGIFTDMIDGTVARVTNSQSELGSKLDTIADFIFLAFCLTILLINIKVSIIVYIFIGIVLIIKFFTLERNYRIKKSFYSDHGILNKLIGLSLATMPYLLIFIDSNILFIVIGAFAILGALIEHLKCINLIA